MSDGNRLGWLARSALLLALLVSAAGCHANDGPYASLFESDDEP